MNIRLRVQRFNKWEIFFSHLPQELMDLDAEFKDNHIEILKRFYVLFESIYKYIKGDLHSPTHFSYVIDCRFHPIRG